MNTYQLYHEIFVTIFRRWRACWTQNAGCRRRAAFVAAVCSTLFLSACGDQLSGSQPLYCMSDEEAAALAPSGCQRDDISSTKVDVACGPNRFPDDDVVGYSAGPAAFGCGDVGITVTVEVDECLSCAIEILRDGQCVAAGLVCLGATCDNVVERKLSTDVALPPGDYTIWGEYSRLITTVLASGQCVYTPWCSDVTVDMCE